MKAQEALDLEAQKGVCPIWMKGFRSIIEDAVANDEEYVVMHDLDDKRLTYLKYLGYYLLYDETYQMYRVFWSKVHYYAYIMRDVHRESKVKLENIYDSI